MLGYEPRLFIAEKNYQAMIWFGEHGMFVIACIFLFFGLAKMTPLKTYHDQSFLETSLVIARKISLMSFIFFAFGVYAMYLLYVGTVGPGSKKSEQMYIEWIKDLAQREFWMIPTFFITGFLARNIVIRYCYPILSRWHRKLRVEQSSDKLDDIRNEFDSLTAMNFIPRKYYSPEKILIGLDENKKPIAVDLSVWNETNMQIIGPTRYGKGVVIGCIADQVIEYGGSVVYIDPKGDKFAPHIMRQACARTGRKFYYLDLSEASTGGWAPFATGPEREAIARLAMAFGLDYTGSESDYYKSQEWTELIKYFAKTRDIKPLHKLMQATEANRINAELVRWAEIQSLCPEPGTGFNVDEALKEEAIIYVRGSLDDNVVLTATKVFIAELIQSSRRLEPERKTNLTTIIDEVSFLTSEILAKSLATSVGFRVKFVLAYQSQNDLLNTDSKNENSKYIHQSINVNSQVKAVYGGADIEVAEWISQLSGTVIKDIPKMERSEINQAGGETWGNQRYIGLQETPHISINQALALPPRVCVFIQPQTLAKICYTSFVPVEDPSLLAQFITSQNTRRKTVQPPLEGLVRSEQEIITDENSGIQQEKLENLFGRDSENLTQTNGISPEKSKNLKNKKRKKKQKKRKADDPLNLKGGPATIKSE